MSLSDKERIAALEKEVSRLRREMDQIKSGKKEVRPAASPLISTLKVKKDKAFVNSTNIKAKNENWIGKLGIGLVVLGAIFLFKFSIDQGWITPLVRILFGIVLAVILLVSGLRIYTKNKILSRLVIGGGIGVYYISIFSAFQLYQLLSHSTAFVLMVIVTTVILYLSMRQNEQGLSIVGLTAGLLTPFMLYTGEGNIPGLVSYTMVLNSAALTIYYKKAWRSLLWLSHWGSWIVLAIAVESIAGMQFGFLIDKWSTQIGIILTWSLFALFPPLRFIRFGQKPDHALEEGITPSVSKQMPLFNFTRKYHIHFISLTLPFWALGLTVWLWSYGDTAATLINSSTALVYIIIYLWLRREKLLLKLGQVHLISATLLISWALLIFFTFKTSFVLLIATYLLLFLWSLKSKEGNLSHFSNAFMLLFALVLLLKLSFASAAEPFLMNWDVLRDIISLAFIVVYAWQAYKLKMGKILALLAYIGLAAFISREAVVFENGQAIVSVLWSLMGVPALIYGIFKKKEKVRVVGIITIAIVVAKLFLVDFEHVSALWRIFLFISIGGLFLILNNYIQNRIRKSENGNEQQD